MMLDKNALKRLIESVKPNEMLVLPVNSIEKNSLKSCQKEIDRFINKSDDYVITIIRKS